MALVVGLPAALGLGAVGAALVPSAMASVATALRLEQDQQAELVGLSLPGLSGFSSRRDREGTVPPGVDALLQRVIYGDLGDDLDGLGLPSSDEDADALDDDTQSTRAPSEGPYDVNGEGARPGLDTWSVVWYCGMFAAFTSLFLIMPCSQVLCRAGLLHGHTDPRLRPRTPHGLSALQTAIGGQGYATPPPPYKQFAPPAYEDVILDLGFAPGFAPPGKAVPVPEKDKEAKEASVYVIPLGPDSAPASTLVAA